jgi:hypothetical protein
MNELRELTDAELDFVGGGYGMVGGCGTTATAATLSRPTSEPLGLRLAEDIVCVIFSVLQPNTDLKRVAA